MDDRQARVLGCLLEKERTTPDAYPLSLNALVNACNQTTNRSPVVQYDEETVEAALDELRERGYVRRGVYPGSRVIKYRHAVDEVLALDAPSGAVLCVLLLRGPQTAGELKARTERLHPFGDLAAVEDALDELARHEDGPLVERLAREPGRKEPRIRELLSDAGSSDRLADRPVTSEPVGTTDAPAAQEATRLVALEERVAALEQEVERLRSAWDG